MSESGSIHLIFTNERFIIYPLYVFIHAFLVFSFFPTKCLHKHKNSVLKHNVMKQFFDDLQLQCVTEYWITIIAMEIYWLISYDRIFIFKVFHLLRWFLCQKRKFTLPPFLVNMHTVLRNKKERKMMKIFLFLWRRKIIK